MNTALSIIIAALGFAAGWIWHESSDQHQVYKAGYEAFIAQRDYYHHQAMAIIAEGRSTKGRKQ